MSERKRGRDEGWKGYDESIHLPWTKYSRRLVREWRNGTSSLVDRKHNSNHNNGTWKDRDFRYRFSMDLSWDRWWKANTCFRLEMPSNESSTDGIPGSCIVRRAWINFESIDRIKKTNLFFDASIEMNSFLNFFFKNAFEL